jgi:site-specific recombinase XerD
VRQTKFGKTRWVPFGPQLGYALSQYVARGTRTKSQADASFFTSRKGTRIATRTLEHNFRYLCQSAGIRRTDHPRFQPRLHDLRHTFAVHRLTSWYQKGADVQRLLPFLSVYLGHVCLRHTQVYLSATPELLREAGQRFEIYADKENHHE